MVGAADSHARTLGRVVSHAFATARAERELMIARALVTGKAVGAQPGFVTDPGWARAIDHFLSDADEVLDVTVVDEANVVAEAVVPRRRLVPPPLPPPPPSRRRSRVGLGGAVVGMTAVAAIVGFIFAKAPLGASPPAARPAPVTAAAPVHADIAPLPAAVCLGVSCPATAPRPAIAPAPAPTILPTLATAPALSPAPAWQPTPSRRRSRLRPPRRPCSRDGRTRRAGRPRRIHASRHRDARPNPAIRRREPRHQASRFAAHHRRIRSFQMRGQPDPGARVGRDRRRLGRCARTGEGAREERPRSRRRATPTTPS